MPRKTRVIPYATIVPRCFNEAAARCRGKRARGEQPDVDSGDASMRPRPDAAENLALAAALLGAPPRLQ